VTATTGGPSAAVPATRRVPWRVAAPGRTAPGSSSSVSRLASRCLDVVLACTLLLLLLPLLLVVVATLLETGRPVLFRQERVGRHGERFRIVKFRTMVQDAEALEERLRARSDDPDWLLLDRDPRITRVGGVLRRLSLDEVPQLWQVVTGRMALVGPRPLSVTDAQRLPEWAHERHDVRPGLTGSWQVSGRTRLPFRQMLELDVDYVRHRSLVRDLVLLCRTVPAVLRGSGAN